MAETTAADQRHTLLVVDDSPVNLTLLRGVLEDRYIIKAATSGARALKIAFSGAPIDLILLDIMMPEMDGYEVCRQLKASPETQHIPIIFLTAKTDSADEEFGLQLGAVDYITKPISPPITLARIQTHLALFRQRKALWESRQKLAAELNEAAEYVRQLLPSPLSTPVESAWKHVPCNALGGDAFGHHWLDEDHLAIYLLDVCGHGVGAALLSISVMNTLRSQALGNADFLSPSSVLASLNAAFPMETQNNKYFTIWYGVYSRSKRTISYSSAGHPPAFLVTGRNGSLKLEQLQTNNLAIGCIPGATFKEQTCAVQSSNKLLVFSDGVYELELKDGTIMDIGAFADIFRSIADVERPQVDDIFSRMREMKRHDDFDDDFSLLEICIRD